ncbi:MAG: tetratricopeptide repeat protein, partial [Chloroflexi bacterium]|nr:tetratricopeptide repeat protein [Chloroflexota bacterium]
TPTPVEQEEARIHFDSAVEAIGQNQLGIAAFQYGLAVELDPEFTDAYIGLGMLHFQLQDWESAAADFTRIIELTPGEAMAYYNRALAYQAIGDFQQSVADYTDAIRLDPQFMNAYANRGAVYLEISEAQLALEDFDRAISLEPGPAESYIGRALAYTLLNMDEEAEAAMALAVERGFDQVILEGLVDGLKGQR